MSATDPTMDDIQRSIRHAVRLHWHLFVAQGVITAVLGLAAIIWPQVSTLAVEVYIGVIFFLVGATGLALMFFAPSVSAFLWSLLTAGLSLLAGILLLWHPVEGTVTLTLVLIAFFIVEGLFQIVAAFSYRELFPEAWGWMLLSGIVDLALAALLIMGWPSTASWALGLIVGVNLLSSGIATIMVAISAKQVVKLASRGA